MVIHLGWGMTNGRLVCGRKAMDVQCDPAEDRVTCRQCLWHLYRAASKEAMRLGYAYNQALAEEDRAHHRWAAQRSIANAAS